jgi:multisubunit Na+/H+ antiporter MnhB subunit
MFGAGVISPIGALFAVIVLAIWILVLVWVAARIQAFLLRQTGWPVLDWRNVLLSFLLLTAAIHLGNFGLDLLDRWLNDASYPLSLGFPGSFLIGSVAIGVGIAAVRSRRKK